MSIITKLKYKINEIDIKNQNIEKHNYEMKDSTSERLLLVESLQDITYSVENLKNEDVNKSSMIEILKQKNADLAANILDKENQKINE